MINYISIKRIETAKDGDERKYFLSPRTSFNDLTSEISRYDDFDKHSEPYQKITTKIIVKRYKLA